MANSTISITGTTEDFSLDPFAGGTYRGKVIYDLSQIDANLNRSGYDWYTNNYGELDDGVLNFGFWKNYDELYNSYYVAADESIAFNEAFYGADFSPFNADQQILARESIGLWNDLIAIDFKETKSFEGDINLGNTFTGGAQAYAYLPFGDTDDQFYADAYGFEETGRLGGDVWIDGFVSSNFFPTTNSYYAKITMIHELGHSLGLSHPGDYNATDDNDGDGIPDPITYANDAFFAQDSRQYSVMSYFDAYETGAQHIDFTLLNFAYAATPLVHDISAIQAIYGVDETTRLGNTVYGFNSTADRDEFDFSINTRPIVTVFDSGGIDTLDFSGWSTPSVIDLNEGAFSSGGGVIDFPTLDEVNANRAAIGFAPRTQATFDFYEDLKAELGITNGLFHDNISIAYGTVIENAIGGSGDDFIIANSAMNRITGRNGNDTVSYETADEGVTIALNAQKGAGGAQNDILRFVENLLGSNFDDLLIGNVGSNKLEGGLGNDVLRGLGGTDTFVFRTDASATGLDRVADFTSLDVIAVDKMLDDSDGDGIISADARGYFVLDATDGDAVNLGATTAAEGLTFVGQNGNFFYYANASSTITSGDVAKLVGVTDRPQDINQNGVSNLAPSDSSLFTDVDATTTHERDANYVNPYGIQQGFSADLDGDGHAAGRLAMAAFGSVGSSAFGGDSAGFAAGSVGAGVPVDQLILGMVHAL